jgi:hypothetical protein
MLVLLHLIEATFAATPIRPELHERFLDDAMFGGPIDELNTFFEKMIPIASSLGLTLNDRKCEIISDPDASFIPPLANFGQKLPRNRWTILGCPCGSFEFAEEFCTKVAERVTRRLQPLRQREPQLAFALLRFCGPFPSVSFYMRSCDGVFRRLRCAFFEVFAFSLIVP